VALFAHCACCGGANRSDWWMSSILFVGVLLFVSVARREPSSYEFGTIRVTWRNANHISFLSASSSAMFIRSF
jgi:hypothetical protein